MQQYEFKECMSTEKIRYMGPLVHTEQNKGVDFVNLIIIGNVQISYNIFRVILDP